MSPEQESNLISAAHTGAKNALTSNQLPKDRRFGAALLTTEGNIYASGSYFSDTYSLTLHAEQAALAHAASHGEYNIIAIAITSNETGVSYPCHMCKQLLWESQLRSKIDMEILLVIDETVIERFKLSEIMTHTWPK